MRGDRVVVYSQPSEVHRLLNILPEKIACCVTDTVLNAGVRLEAVSEIRLRRGRYASLSIDRYNLTVAHVCTEEELSKLTERLCGGSVYAYEGSLREGFVAAGNGCRAAVCGRGSAVNGEWNTGYYPESVVLRIPLHTEGHSKRLAELFYKERRGMIIFSQPAVGKTTFLRDMAITLSRGRYSLRTVLVDSREELDDGKLPRECLIDVLPGYPRAKGIECATRTLSPDVIVTDELYGSDDMEAVLSAASRGVPLIASCHASSVAQLMADEGMEKMVRHGVFGYAAELIRPPGQRVPELVVTDVSCIDGVECENAT